MRALHIKSFLTTSLLLLHISVLSQTLELSGGYLLNHLFDTEDHTTHWKNDYTNGSGFSIVMAVEDIKFEWTRLRLSIAYERYDGKLDIYNGGLGGGGGHEAEFEKSLFSVCAFPVGFKVMNELDIQIGLQMSWLLHENFSGKGGWWQYNPGGPSSGGSYILEEEQDKYNAPWYIGLVGRIAYNFKISGSIYISPQYSYYLGLSKEFREYPESQIRSMRHFFGAGIEKRLGKEPKGK